MGFDSRLLGVEVEVKVEEVVASERGFAGVVGVD
jgi:hypothetical protein